MIAKDTTTTVNFYAMTTAGLAATGQASNITASISTNGGTATTFSGIISEKDSVNQPGWYKFSYTFSTAGNVFITFSCTNCIIEPWEDEVVEISASSAPSASDIALAVWSYEDENNLLCPCRSIHMVEIGNTLYTPMVEGQYGGYDALVNAIWGFNPATLLSQTSAALRLVDIQDNAARPGDAMTLTAAYNAAKTASQFNASTDAVIINSTQAATMVTATGFATPANITAAQTAIINAMPSTTGLATSSDISTAQTAIINAIPSTTGLATGSDVSSAQAAIIAAMPDVSGLSTFDPSTDDVNVSTTSISNIQSGLATSSNVSSAQTAIINALPSTSGLATSSDVSTAQAAIIAAMPDVSGLSTFNPTTTNVNVSSTSVSNIQSGLATSANVTAAQAAIINAMPSTTGLATSTDITNAVTEIETHGDENWRGGSGPSGGGITAEDVWKYSGTYGRSLTTSPTDISSLATKTDVTAAQTAIVNAMPSTTGLATSSDVSTAQTAIINAMPTVPNNLATSTDVANAKADVIAAIPGDYAKASDLTAVKNLLTQLDAGVLHWSTSPTRLVLYKEDNSVLRVYNLERDADGNITRISPLNA